MAEYGPGVERVPASQVRDELEALTRCHALISGLDDASQGRVLRWLSERLEQERLDREEERNKAAREKSMMESLSQAAQRNPEPPF